MVGSWGEPDSLNPLLCQNANCSQITSLLFPAFIGVDPVSGYFAPNQPGALVESWMVSSDNLTYTISLRNDWYWSDGRPIIAHDIQYAWQAIHSETLEGGPFIVDITDVTVIDDYTLQITVATPDCGVLYEIAQLPVVPSHILEAAVGQDYASINTLDFNTAPNVTAGVFQFEDYTPGQQISLVPNAAYPDALAGAVRPAKLVWTFFVDAQTMIAALEAGDIDVITGTIPRENFARLRESGQQTYEYPVNTMTHVGLNMADPTHPQNGLDAAGNLIDQGHHPILGDVRVRRALVMAVDVDAIIQGTLFGAGTRISSFSVPTSWADNPDLTPIPYDSDGARALLKDAGWEDTDGDGILDCLNCLYAPVGTPLQFSLLTPTTNTARVAAVQIISAYLAQIGVQVDATLMEFTALLDSLGAQTFDAYLLSWSLGFPVDPDPSEIFEATGDVVGNVSNMGSYYNPELEALLNQARTVPDCDLAERQTLYHQVQRILQADAPYIFLYTTTSIYAAQPGLEGFNPFPNQLFWNVDTWGVRR